MKKPGARAAPVEGQASVTSLPFLTEDQRAALDAALSKKQSEPDADGSIASSGLTPIDPTALLTRISGKSSSGSPHRALTKREAAHDRHLQRRGKGPGRTKKGGAGGRFTWGGMLVEEEGRGLVALDPGDPNYDSETEDGGRAERAYWRGATGAAIRRYKASVCAALEEYYDTADPLEVARCLADLEAPQYNWWFVKRALELAMSGREAERELTSVLLAALRGEALSSADVSRGFRATLLQLDDIVLDVPNAPELLALFAGRAIVDEALPPAFLAAVGADAVVGALPTTREVVALCEGELDAKHGAERLARCWGSSSLRFDLEESKAALASMLDEYAAAGDVAEVRRLLLDMDLPFYHHELVKQVLVRALERGAHAGSYGALLASLAETGAVSATQMAKGFCRVAARLPDLELDAPGAAKAFDDLVSGAERAGWLESDWSSSSEESTPRTPGDGVFTSGAAAAPASVAEFKREARETVREYFESGDRAEVSRWLLAAGDPGFGHVFVRLALEAALDRRDRERELVSVLLAELVPAVVGQDEACMGFRCALANADELSLDVPDAEPLLALFLGRAVVDEVLPPAFLADSVGCGAAAAPENGGAAPRSPRRAPLAPGTAGRRIVEHARAHLAARHCAERLQTCWHARVQSATELAVAMRDVVVEYLSSRDAAEAERCLADLAVPHFLHEFVVRALLGAFAREADVAPVLDLLGALADTGMLTQTQVALGFSRVAKDLDDIALDFPLAPKIFADVKLAALERGWLPDGEA